MSKETYLERSIARLKVVETFCKSSEQCGTIEIGNKRIRMVKDTIGEAVYIYTSVFYGEEIANINHKFDLAAIYAKENLYFVNKYVFDLYNGFNAEQQYDIITFSELAENLYQKMIKDVFPSYYDKIQPTHIEEELEDDERIREVYRRSVFEGVDYNTPKVGRNSELTDLDVANYLAGFTTETELFIDVLGRSKEYYNYQKSLSCAISKYLETHNLIEDYELEILTALNNLGDVKTVTVEFEKDGKTAQGKITVSALKNIVRLNDYFADYSFATDATGKKIYEKLGIELFGNHNNRLYTSDITRILFRNKAIYTKKD
jgi:nitrogen regulatory protein PII